jgi:hypothetical protein
VLWRYFKVDDHHCFFGEDAASSHWSTSMPDIPEEPKKSAADVAYTVAKAAVSAVPVVGGPEKVSELTPERLSRNEAFVSTALRATEIAVRTHEHEKLEALRNAVMSSALPDAPDDTLQQIFLNHVDSLTPWHLRILTIHFRWDHLGTKTPCFEALFSEVTLMLWTQVSWARTRLLPRLAAATCGMMFWNIAFGATQSVVRAT